MKVHERSWFKTYTDLPENIKESIFDTYIVLININSFILYFPRINVCNKHYLWTESAHTRLL